MAPLLLDEGILLPGERQTPTNHTSHMPSPYTTHSNTGYHPLQVVFCRDFAQNYVEYDIILPMVATLMPDRPVAHRALGRAVANARVRAGLTQPELAERARVSQSYLSLIEIGRRRPTPEILRALATALHVSYEQFAVLAGYADAPEGEVAVIVPPADVEEIKQFSRLPSWARQIGLAAGKAAERLSPIEQVPNQPQQRRGADGTGEVGDGEPDE